MIPSVLEAGQVISQRSETEEPVYSNFDHVLDFAVEKILEEECYFSQHAAWSFCGYVYCQAGLWYEVVMVYKTVVEVLEGASASDVIDQAITKYGRD